MAAIAVVAACTIAALIVARGISRPLRTLTARLEAMSAGMLDGVVPGIRRGDEIGDMARAVLTLRDHALERLALRDARDVLAIAVVERGQAADAAERLARTDPLTRLANRTGFAQAVAACAGSETGFALLCLDLDRFKAVNDALGHPAGDKLLRQVASRLMACVREGDTVARLGGDEFAIIQAGCTGNDQAGTLAARIVEEVGRPFRLSQRDTVEIGVSVGVAVAPGDGTDAEVLIGQADQALYRAKQDGRCCWRAWSDLPDKPG